MTDDRFRRELHGNLTQNILSYWMHKMVDPRGGFYGRRDGYDLLDPLAPKGAVLNGRILWSFSAALRCLGDPRYAEMALRARDYIMEHFIDPEFGGVFWSVDRQGRPLNTKKQFYAIAFVIYGLAEHHRATGDPLSLTLAKELFHAIEAHSRDRVRGGYIEATTREWGEIKDMRLSDKDENSSKTMNTNLHILEAYTALLRVWRDPELIDAQRALVGIFLDRIIDSQTHHLGLFFDDEWRRQDHEISYGHDIEASWLLYEAAEVLGDPDVMTRVKAETRLIAHAALKGRTPDGSLIYESEAPGQKSAEGFSPRASANTERHWWVQAETVVGLMYLWRHHGEDTALEMAKQTWDFIRNNLVDRNQGEWYWSRLPDGSINRNEDKAGFWKCPYHNSRMHLEALTALK